MMTSHKKIDKDVPEGAVIFLGDSLVQGLAVEAVAPYSINYGIDGDTTDGLVDRLPYYASLQRAGLIVIAIGINDLSRRSDAEILGNYQKIIEALPANKPVLLSLIYPVDEISSERSGYNARIKKINSALSVYCTRQLRLYCLDISDEVIAADGGQVDRFHAADGLHLSPAGARLWINHLRSFFHTVINT